MNVIDFVVIILIILGALRGWQRGLFTGIFNFIGTIAGFVIAAREYRSFLSWMETWLPLRQWLEPKIYNWSLPLVRSRISVMENQTLNEILGLLPPGWREHLNPGFLPSIEAFADQVAVQVAQNLSGMVTEYVLRLVAFLLLFLIVIAVLQLLTILILAPFGGREGLFNRLGGAVFGGMSAFVLLAILVGMITPFFDVLSRDSLLKTETYEAFLYPHLMNVFDALSAALWQNSGAEMFEPLKSLKQLRT